MNPDYLNNKDAKVVRLRRQTIQVCAPGVSISTCCTFFDFNHSRNLRLISIRRSSVPQAIHKSRSCEFALESSEENSVSNFSLSPPELKAPIQANWSRLFKPVSRDSEPPIESPAIARD